MDVQRHHPRVLLGVFVFIFVLVSIVAINLIVLNVVVVFIVVLFVYGCSSAVLCSFDLCVLCVSCFVVVICCYLLLFVLCFVTGAPRRPRAAPGCRAGGSPSEVRG